MTLTHISALFSLFINIFQPLASAQAIRMDLYLSLLSKLEDL